MKNHILTALFLLGTSNLAFSADSFAPVESAPAYNWSGAYVGAQVGHAWSDSTVFFLPADSWNIEPNGIEGGLYLGFNEQLSSGLVLGLETEINANGGSGTAPYLKYGEVFMGDPDYWPGEVDLKWSGSTRVRVGYAIDRFMPFATAGVAYAGYDFTTYDAGEVYDKGDSHLVGWTVGAGAEYAINDNWRVRGSYMFTQYNKDTFHSYHPDGDLNVTYDFDMKKQDLKLGVSFNW